MQYPGKYLPLRKGLPWFLLSAGISIMGAAFTLLQAYFIAEIVNEVFLSKSGYDITPWLAGLLAVMAGRAAAQWGSEVAGIKFSAVVKSQLRDRLLQAIYKLGPVEVKRMQTGGLIGILTTGIDTMESYLAKYLPQVVITAVVPLLVLTVITPLDPMSGLLLLITAPAIPVFLILIGRWAEGAQKKQWEQMGRIAGHFLDVLQGLFTLRLFGRSREQINVIKRLSGQIGRGAMDVLKIAFLSAFMLELAATVSTAIIAVAVGLRLLYGSIPFEQAFMILLLVPEFFQPLRTFGSSYHAGLAGAAAIANIEQIIAAAEHVSPQELSQITFTSNVTNIVFNDVWFRYPDRETDALAGVSFALRCGEKTALAGLSGSGKSTIASLLLGFIRPTRGEIFVNGIPLAGLPAGMVTYLPQRPYVFQGTIAENICMGCPDASPEVIKNAAIQAEADAFITALPDGYQTIIGERGYGLSGGERQRLAIARAFLRDTPVVVLDEPTASLDAITEEAVKRALERLFDGKTVIIIAHKVTTIRQADRFIALERGRISDCGEGRNFMAGGSAC